MKKILLFLFFSFYLFAYRVEIHKWNRSDTFYGFLKQYSLPLSIYYNLPIDIKRKVTHIKIGEDIFILKDNNKLKQALIPISTTKQLQIIEKNGNYITKIVPIIFDTDKKFVTITINHSLAYDVYQKTHIRSLTNQIIDIFSDKVNLRILPKDTKIKVLYEEKLRYGKVKKVKILYASISNYKYSYNAFLNPYDGRYYDSQAKSLKGMFLPVPLRYKRISSRFGMRLHPIFHKWIMHDGIDYVNKIGTPIHSVADGKIIFKGWIKGYGRAVKIKHKNGYITLYAHLHRWPKGIYVGKWVRQGQIIGYLGNSGLSTGPHLHFGVMHYGKWINPIKIRNSARITLKGIKKRKFLSYISTLQKEYNIALK